MKIVESKVEIVNPRKDGLPQLYYVTLVQMPFSKQLFSYTSNILICSADESNIASQMKSNVVFSVEKSVEGKDAIVIFEVQESMVKNSNPEGQKMADMGKMFAIPTNRLVLSLDQKGNIKGVLNEREVYSKWRELYKTLSEGMGNELKQQLKDNGDREFNNILKGIQNSFLHAVFFNPIYQYEISTYAKHSFDMSNNIKLIQGENVELKLGGKMKQVNNDSLIINYSSYLYGDSGLLKSARKLYQDAIPKESDVKVDIDVDYVYDIRSALPTYIVATYMETIEGTIKYKQQSEVKILS